MRWRVEGADATTGHEVRTTVEALTQAEAEAAARYNGILVSKVGPDVPEPSGATITELQYESKTSPAPVAPPAGLAELEQLARATEEASQSLRSRAPLPLAYVTPETAAGGPPGYRDIVVIAGRINTAATLVGWFGWIVLAYGAFLLMAQVIDGRSMWVLARYVWELTPGAALIIGGMLLRLLAATAVAVRDIARNSYRDTRDDGRDRVSPAGSSPASP